MMQNETDRRRLTPSGVVAGSGAALLALLISATSFAWDTPAKTSTSRNAAAALVAIMALVTARPASAGQDTPTIVLRVANDAHLSRESLLQGEERATRVYDAIGVRLIWVHDDSAEDQLPEALHLRLVLLSRKTADQKFAKEGIADNIAGQALHDEGRADIFPDRIAALAARYNWTRASMLGYVLAHETGHLVLPPPSHSEAGIMSANLHLRSKGLERFSAEQGATIRAMLREAVVLAAAETSSSPIVAP